MGKPNGSASGEEGEPAAAPPPEAAPGALPALPDRPAPHTGASVLLYHCNPIDPHTFAQALADHLGMVRFDAMDACRRAGGMIADNVDPQAAQALAAALTDLGERCVVVPAAEVVQLPPVRVAHSAVLKQKTASFTDSAGHATEVAWSQGVALALGSITVQHTDVKTRSAASVLTQPMIPVGGFGIPIPRAPLKVTTSKRATLVDVVFLSPPNYIRVYARQFDYTLLGDQRQTTADANLLTLARWFAYMMPQVHTNFDTAALINTGRVDVPAYEPRVLADTLQWLVNVAVHGVPVK